jgi:cytosine/adenosine deaminase-related metal-dependent hydrolase
LIVHRAAWVLPVSRPPIRDGWVAVEHGRIAAAGGPGSSPPSGGTVREEEPGWPAVILPGLVNAHTHLELSWMRGQVPPAQSMPEWVARLMSLRRSVGHEPAAPIAEAVRDVRRCGTAAVGDITNTLAAYGPLLDSDMSGCVFRELLGFNVQDAEGMVADAVAQLGQLTPAGWLRRAVVPHAPYSVAPALLRAIAGARRGDGPLSIHLAESAEEIEFLSTGAGPWRALLEDLGAWNPRWQPPRCGPVEYLDRCRLLNSALLAVHCVHTTDDELRRLAAAGATVVTCPRSNRWTGVGTPPIERFYASGVRVAIGTDSLASADDLNLFSELAAVRRAAPGVPAAAILESATRSGAAALGFESELGTIESGKRAELIAVRVPHGVTDVEEYLLGGIQPSDIGWLDPEP